MSGNIGHNTIQGGIGKPSIAGRTVQHTKAGEMKHWNMHGDISHGVGDRLPEYQGETILYSLASEIQVLPTANTSVYDDIVVLTNQTEELPNGNGTVFVIY